MSEGQSVLKDHMENQVFRPTIIEIWRLRSKKSKSCVIGTLFPQTPAKLSSIYFPAQSSRHENDVSHSTMISLSFLHKTVLISSGFYLCPEEIVSFFHCLFSLLLLLTLPLAYCSGKGVMKSMAPKFLSDLMLHVILKNLLSGEDEASHTPVTTFQDNKSLRNSDPWSLLQRK